MQNSFLDSIFNENSKGQFIPRSIIFDTDDFVINKIGKSNLFPLFDQKLMTRGFDSGDV